MKRSALLFLLFVSLLAQAQNQDTINNYKYVLVPEKFDFLRDNNQYGLNGLLKSLMEQKGFFAHYDNPEIPKELAADRCHALKAEVTQRKSLFVTNLTLFLKDCQGNIVFKSKEGKSREKDYAVAYNEALRDAFSSLNNVQYAYNGTVNTRAQKTEEAPAAQAARPSETTPAIAAVTEAAGTLYAQATMTGYQLIDTTPKKVMTLLKTSTPDYFIADKDAYHGVVFKRNGEWIFEYYKEDKLNAEKLSIKF